MRDGCALFSGGLRNVFSLADLKLERLLDSFDDWARDNDGAADLDPPERYRADPSAGVRAVAARPAQRRDQHDRVGHRLPARLRWLDVPVVDAKGNLRHDGGTVDSPGMYALGLPVLRRRKSTFIHGIDDDAREVVDHLSGYLASSP